MNISDINTKTTNITTKNGVTYITFPALSNIPFIKHGFSTKHGGVSEGIYSTMNLSFTRGDNSNNVYENFKRISEVIGINHEDLVFSDQVHKADIQKVGINDKGKGIIHKNDIKEIDGLITNETGVPLVTFYADCVPLYFVDGKNKAIGLVHSGWRGTVAKIGKKAVKSMEQNFGTNPQDIIAVIGPSICKKCYEVSKDVAEQFEQIFNDQNNFNNKAIINTILEYKGNDKYLLDLWQANKIILLEAGLLEQNINVTDLCTCCRNDIFFSHRVTKGERGSLAALLSL